MRLTEIRRHYEQLRSGLDLFPLETVSIDGHSYLGSVLARMSPGVTVLCGISGVGKSQFLSVLAAHLQGRGTAGVAVAAMGNDVRGRVESTREGGRVELNPTTARCLYVDTAYECYDTIRQVRQTEGLEEKRAAADVTPLRADWTNRLRYILGRDYEQVSFQELERESVESTDPPTWHYYELRYQGVEYGPDQMSLGELAASVVLRALRSSQKGDIILLDEPENFLSPRARQSMLDVIVEQAVTKKLSVIVASHSAEIVKRLPSGSMRTIERGASGAIISNASAASQVIRAIGLDVRPDVLLIVEDDFAGKLLKAILARVIPPLHREVEVVAVWGEGEVARAAEVLWRCNLGVRALGVLDGDRRDAPQCQQDYLTFLPGGSGPEDLVLQAITESAPDAALAIGVPMEELGKALRNAEGVDLHDRPEVVAQVIGVQVSDLISYGARWLLQSPEYERHLATMRQRIDAFLGA